MLVKRALSVLLVFIVILSLFTSVFALPESGGDGTFRTVVRNARDGEAWCYVGEDFFLDIYADDVNTLHAVNLPIVFDLNGDEFAELIRIDGNMIGADRRNLIQVADGFSSLENSNFPRLDFGKRFVSLMLLREDFYTPLDENQLMCTLRFRATAVHAKGTFAAFTSEYEITAPDGACYTIMPNSLGEPIITALPAVSHGEFEVRDKTVERQLVSLEPRELLIVPYGTSSTDAVTSFVAKKAKIDGSIGYEVDGQDGVFVLPGLQSFNSLSPGWVSTNYNANVSGLYNFTASPNISAESIVDKHNPKLAASQPVFVKPNDLAVNEHMVIFFSDGTIYDTQKVKDGENAIEPATPPTKAGHAFIDWEPSDLTNITDDCVFVAKFEPLTTTYTVKFVDFDDSVIKTQLVHLGDAAIAPVNPTRVGYTFTKWDKAYNNITSDLTVKAEYEINRYTVQFLDYNGIDLKTETVEHGSSATAPNNPSREGYTFTSWDRAFSNITSNLTVTAQYTIKSYTVKFVDHDGTELKSEAVTHGGKATAPSDPVRAGYSFIGWDIAFDNVISDLTVTAQYKEIIVITFVTGNHGTGTMPVGNVLYGETYYIPANGFDVEAGYRFTGWYDGTNTYPILGGKIENATQNVTLTAQYEADTLSYNISGKLTGLEDSENHTVTCIYTENGTDATLTTQTDIYGNYVFIGIPVGAKAVIVPPTQLEDKNPDRDQEEIEVIDKSHTDIDFVYAVQTYTISGKLTGGNIGARLITYSIDGGLLPGIVTTDSSGNYVILAVRRGSNIVITPPSQSNYSVSPASITLNDVKDDMTEQNFTYTYSGGGTSSGGSNGGITTKLVINCLDEDGKLLFTKTVTTVRVGTTETVNAPDVDGYRVTDESVKTITIKSGTNTVEFKYQKNDKAELDKENHYRYIAGYPDGTINPNGHITREEVATIFYRLLTRETRKQYRRATTSFADVDPYQWSVMEIGTMQNVGVIHGRGEDAFDPKANITRAEFATIAMRFDNLEEGATHNLTDVSGHWAETYIAAAVSRGWVVGYPDDSFRPDLPITRAEAMTLINRVLERNVDKDGILQSLVTSWTDLPLNHWAYYEIQEATISHKYVRRNENDIVENWTDKGEDVNFDEDDGQIQLRPTPPPVEEKEITPKPAELEYIFHTVVFGDTLWGISIKYGTTVDAIKELNNLVSDVLQLGQVLKIKLK